MNRHGFNLLILLANVLIGFLFIGCNESEDPDTVREENSLYFDFKLDGIQYRSEILESNLIPGSGFEKVKEGTFGLNVMIYNYFDYSISMLFSNSCGTAENKDCLTMILTSPNPLKMGAIPNLSINSFEIGGNNYSLRYIGPEIAPRPSDLTLKMEITKFDEESKILEGTLTGSVYKQNEGVAKVYPLNGKFRLNIYKG